MRKEVIQYEPAFGGIVFVLAAVFLGLAVFGPGSKDTGLIAMIFCGIGCVRTMSWGAGQIVGYREANRTLDSASKQSPVLGAAVGCVFLGLMSLMLTSLLYEFSANQSGCLWLTGSVTVGLLSIGAVVGIRDGTWRSEGWPLDVRYFSRARV
jgi:hypothetical protein